MKTENNTKMLKELFINELSDIYDAEQRIGKALSKMAKLATSEELKSSIMLHLEETKTHVTKVEQVFACFDTKAKRKTCKATVGLLEEGESLIEEFKGSCALDAAIISALQKVEHYEIASYGSLHEWANMLQNEEAANFIQEILTQEKVADQKLSELAEARVNKKALTGKDEIIKENSLTVKSKVPKKTMPIVDIGKKNPKVY